MQDRIEQGRKNEDPMITGIAKLLRGGVTGVPIGIANVVRSIPRGVGSLIGAREKNPIQEIPNPRAEDVESGVADIRRAVGRLSSPRQNVMESLGLEEIPEEKNITIKRENVPSSLKTVSPPEKIAQAKEEFNPSKYKDVYDALSQMSDKNFVKFTSKYKIPGVGYAEKGGKIIRSITRSQTEQGTGEEELPADITMRDMEILSKFLPKQGTEVTPSQYANMVQALTPKTEKLMRQNPATGAYEETIEQPDYKGATERANSILKAFGVGKRVDFGEKGGRGIDPADFESSYISSLKASGKKDTPKARAAAMKRYKELMGIKE